MQLQQSNMKASMRPIKKRTPIKFCTALWSSQSTDGESACILVSPGNRPASRTDGLEVLGCAAEAMDSREPAMADGSPGSAQLR